MMFGGILFFACVVMLWMNERRHVKTSKRLEKARKICERKYYKIYIKIINFVYIFNFIVYFLDLNPLEVNPNTEGKLVHAEGETFCNEFIVDNQYAVNVSNSVKLIRVCEMYQW